MFTAADVPDLSGKTVVVTGANSGLGLEASRVLAGAGATVLMTARSPVKFDAAVEQAGLDGAGIEFVQLDLADLSSVRSAAERLTACRPQIDVLINNAGVMFTPEATTADGLELQLGTNHFGHFALTGLLLESLLAADEARVVTLSSGAHNAGTMDFDDLHQQNRSGYNTLAAYGRSKLANLMFALELQRRFTAAGLPHRSVAAHPGMTDTNLLKSGLSMPGGGWFRRIAGPAFRLLNPVVTMSVAEGARSQLYAAVGDVDGGTYWGPQRLGESRGPVGPARINPKAQDEDAARRLWDVSVETTGVDYAALDV